ncbi:hypothetical protein D9M73_177810 [compost metagenome]
MGNINTPRLCCHLPAAGDHVRALAEQLRRQRRRQFQWCPQRQRWPLQLRALTRPLAGEGGELVAAQGDFFVEGIELAMGFRQRRLGLADFEMGADAALQTLLRQLKDLLLLLQGRINDVPLRVMQREFDVDAHDVVLQFQLGLSRFGDRHVCHVHRTLGGIAFAAPEVEGITETQCGVVVPGRGVGQLTRTVERVGGPVVALEGGIAIDLQRLG